MGVRIARETGTANPFSKEDMKGEITWKKRLYEAHHRNLAPYVVYGPGSYVGVAEVMKADSFRIACSRAETDAVLWVLRAPALLKLCQLFPGMYSAMKRRAVRRGQQQKAALKELKSNWTFEECAARQLQRAWRGRAGMKLVQALGRIMMARSMSKQLDSMKQQQEGGSGSDARNSANSFKAFARQGSKADAELFFASAGLGQQQEQKDERVLSELSDSIMQRVTSEEPGTINF